MRLLLRSVLVNGIRLLRNSQSHCFSPAKTNCKLKLRGAKFNSSLINFCLHKNLAGSTVTILICSVRLWMVLPSVLTVVVRLVRDAPVAKESGTVAGEYNHACI